MTRATRSRQAKPATLADVAREAGVSVPTASRILNGGVRGATAGTPELRQHVTAVARELGYSVSTAAQAIKDGRARTVAVLVSDIADVGSATMIAGVMQAAEEHGVSVAVLTTHDDADREIELLTRLRGERHRAVILATSRTTDERRESAVDQELRTLREQGAAIVVIGDSSLAYPRVTFDNRKAAAGLASRLVAAGSRRFAIISGPEEQITSRDRVAGFLEGLDRHGIVIDHDAVVHADFSRDGGHRAVRALGDRIRELDVVAAMSDAMAVGAIAALREIGVAVPADVDVTGFDHVPMLGDVMPEFSTVDVPLKSFGEAALRIALEPGDDPARDRSIELQAQTIVRGTLVD